MKGKFFVLLFLFFFLFTQLGSAAPPAKKEPPTKSGVQDDSYKLGPGDVIDIVVWNHNDLNATIIIPPDGRILYPFLAKEIDVTGMPVRDFTKLIRKGVATQIRNPVVFVHVKEYRKPFLSLNHIYVLGEIRVPGVHSIKKGYGISEVIALAGGLTAMADKHNIVITRLNKDKVVVDLDQVILEKDPKKKFLLQEGDVVFIPETKNMVSVLGFVGKPGLYPFKDGDRITDAIAQAGGIRERGILGKVTIIRADRSIVSVDFSGVKYKSTFQNNILLQPKDTIIIPETTNNITVLGAVNRSGAFEIKDGDRITDAIGYAGGVQPRAALKKTTIYRQGKTIPIDLSKILDKKDFEQNLALIPGDVLLIPLNQDKVAVLGMVKMPSFYDINEGDRVVDVLARAGGAIPRGITMRIVLIRKNKDNPQQAVIYPVNLDHILKTGDNLQNHLLQDGDVVYVPETSTPNWVRLITDLSGFGYFFRTFVLGK